MARKLRVLYFIGSYGPDAMGTASHEGTLLALRERGHHVEVLTQVNKSSMRRLRRVGYKGITTFEVNVAGTSGAITRAARALAGRFLQYEYIPVLLGALRRIRSRGYDLIHAEGAYP